MANFQERLEQARKRVGPSAPNVEDDQRPQFLMIWFTCCQSYNRIYRNAMGSAYEGHCPNCGAHVRAGIGPDGTSRRMFEAR